MEVIIGVIMPFIGTILGSSLVFFMKEKINKKIEKLLLGFAAGVMVAASIWSLIIPSLEMGEGTFYFLPTVVGFIFGILFLLLLDQVTPHIHLNSSNAEGVKSKFNKRTLMVFAVIIHNIPEGMAIGVLLAGAVNNDNIITLTGALSLSVGIAIQNIPEGAIVSMPLKEDGVSKKKSFLMGMLSGAVEPLAALFTIIISKLAIPVLPYMLSFAAGAMIYVVIEELIPETQDGKHSNLGTISFAVGFVLMLILDNVLG